jgi:hypothetical protein
MTQKAARAVNNLIDDTGKNACRNPFRQPLKIGNSCLITDKEIANNAL